MGQIIHTDTGCQMEGGLTWKVSHSSTKRRNESSMTLLSSKRKTTTSAICDRYHRRSLPGRISKTLLSRHSSRLPQFPNLPNQEACVWTAEGDKRDRSLTSTGRWKNKEEGLRCFFRALVVPPPPPRFPLLAEFGKGHLIWGLGVSHPHHHPWAIAINQRRHHNLAVNIH